MDTFDYRTIVSVYAACLSTYIFFRTYFLRVRFQFRYRPSSSSRRLTIRATSLGSKEVFVEKVLLIGRNGGRLGEIDLLEFLRSYEVKTFDIEGRSFPEGELGGVSVVASGRVFVASSF